jgi:hypothetical protein
MLIMDWLRLWLRTVWVLSVLLRSRSALLLSIYGFMLLESLMSSVDSGLQPTPSYRYAVSVDELSILPGQKSTLLRRLGRLISSCISVESSRSGMYTMEREVSFRFYRKGE